LPVCSGFQVRIEKTTVGDPVRNISIVPVAAEQTFLQKPYQAGFLDLVKGERKAGGWVSAVLHLANVTLLTPLGKHS
jgi:hypothetical protein